jgi:hypothetical protein
VGIPALLAAIAFAAWHFLPRTLLPPEKIGNLLDQASTGKIPSFSSGSRGLNSVKLMSGGTVWGMPSGNVLMQGLGDNGSLSPDGESVLFGGSIYNLRTKQSITLENPNLQVSQYGTRLMRYSPAGTLIAVGRSGTLYLLDSVTGKIVHILFDKTGPTTSNESCYILTATFSPDEKTVAAGDANGNISLWSVKEGELQGTLAAQITQPCADVQEAWKGNPSGAVMAVAFSPDGRLLASADTYGVVRLWQVSSRTVIHTLPLNLGPGGVRFGPDGKLLLTSGSYTESGQLHRVYLFVDVSSGRVLRATDLAGFGTLEFTSDGTLLIASIQSGRIKVDSWSLPMRLRIPFTSPANPTATPAEAGLLAAYEEQAIILLPFLQTSLVSYRSAGTFPHTIKDLENVLAPHFGDFREGIHGYRYTYTAGSADAQGNIASYVISAQPLVYQQTGLRSFRLDETGEVHATTEPREAAASDPLFETLQSAVQPTPADTHATEPVIPQENTTGQASAGPAEASQWIARAESQFQQGDYHGAIQSCDAALHLNPSDIKAKQLKAKIESTMKILGKQ